MANQQLYSEMKILLQKAYQGQNLQVADPLLKTLAMMVTGVILGPHVQLYALAMCVPLPIKLVSIVRRFSGFVADSRVDAQIMFAPFVYAMQATLSADKVYLIIDCTKVGPKCRVLVIALVYHGTVLPIIWQSIKSKKGHVKGDFQKELLEKVSVYFNDYRQVTVYCSDTSTPGGVRRHRVQNTRSASAHPGRPLKRRTARSAAVCANSAARPRWPGHK